MSSSSPSPVALSSRVPLAPPTSPLLRLGEWWSRRRYGDVLAPGRAYAHQPRVLRSLVRLELGVERWRALPRHLQSLAVLATASAIGCAWCVDFGSWIVAEDGMTEQKVRAVSRWRDAAGVFDDEERAVLAYAEAMTATPPAVTDAMAADLRSRLGDDGLVELTALVAVENLRARGNAALGLPAQGFARECAIPDPR